MEVFLTRKLDLVLIKMYIYITLKLTDMAFLKLHTSKTLGVILIIVGLLLGGFFLLFGVGYLIIPEVAEGDLTNTIACLVVISIGLAFLLLAIAVFRGLLSQKKSSTVEDKT